MPNDHAHSVESKDSNTMDAEINQNLKRSNSPNSPVNLISSKKTSLHIPFAPQGGVGKSWMAMVLADYLAQEGRSALCLDADPTNKTLSTYRSLYATPITIFRNGDELDIEALDECIEWIMSEPSDFVLDIGSSGFVAFASYLMRDNIIQLITDSGKDVYIHIVVTGDRQNHTFSAAKDIIKQMPEVSKKVMWLNSAFGPIDRESDIVSFCERKNIPVIRVWYQHRNSDEAVAKAMIRDGLTFSEILQGDHSQLARRRIEPFWNRMRAYLIEAMNNVE